MKRLRLKLQDRLWWKLASWAPKGWFGRVLFCWPCEPIYDHCGKPEHDYCARCGRSMPGEAPRYERSAWLAVKIREDES